SKLVKEIALFGGDITRFVSPQTREDVLARVQELGRLGEY
ncbi:MAG TPA: pantetheine-phosphate adenylyltransferase, partial [Novosphingobium sp.]